MSFDLPDFNRQVMHAYREIQEFHQRNLRLISKTPPASIVSVMAKVAELTVAYATGIAPYLTGTLAYSHRGELEVGNGYVNAIIFLDPTVVNPVFGGKPVDYGPRVQEDQPWLLEWTTDWLINDLLPNTGDELLDALIDYLVLNYGDAG